MAQASPDFFKGLTQSPLTGEGQTFLSPFFIQEASVFGSLFFCDYQSAQNLLPAGLKALQIWPLKKAALGIHAIEYRKTDIGPYNELAISILLQNRSLKIIPTYIYQLPVTTELSVIGGKKILGYPKFLAEIEFRETLQHRICTLRDKDSLDLLLEIEYPLVPQSPLKITTEKQKHITIQTHISESANPNALFEIDLTNAQHSFLWPQTNLRLGKSPFSKKLEDLQIGHAFYQIQHPHCQAYLRPHPQRSASYV